MKKLMIAAAIVCAAVAANAAAVTWQSAAAPAYNGKTLYLLTAIQSTYTSVEAFKNSAVDSAAVKKVGMIYKISQRTAENEAITSTANFYLAFLDDDNTTIHYVDVSSDMRGYVYEPPSASPGTYNKAFADVATSLSTAKIESTPEPTSALLMLLGMAGLALKRKRG